MYYYYYTLDVFDQPYSFRNSDEYSCIIVLNHEESIFFFISEEITKSFVFTNT